MWLAASASSCPKPQAQFTLNRELRSESEICVLKQSRPVVVEGPRPPIDVSNETRRPILSSCLLEDLKSDAVAPLRLLDFLGRRRNFLGTGTGYRDERSPKTSPFVASETPNSVTMRSRNLRLRGLSFRRSAHLELSRAQRHKHLTSARDLRACW